MPHASELGLTQVGARQADQRPVAAVDDERPEGAPLEGAADELAADEPNVEERAIDEGRVQEGGVAMLAALNRTPRNVQSMKAAPRSCARRDRRRRTRPLRSAAGQVATVPVVRGAASWWSAAAPPPAGRPSPRSNLLDHGARSVVGPPGPDLAAALEAPTSHDRAIGAEEGPVAVHLTVEMGALELHLAVPVALQRRMAHASSVMSRGYDGPAQRLTGSAAPQRGSRPPCISRRRTARGARRRSVRQRRRPWARRGPAAAAGPPTRPVRPRSRA